jgi:hypothetical protein
MYITHVQYTSKIRIDQSPTSRNAFTQCNHIFERSIGIGIGSILDEYNTFFLSELLLKTGTNVLWWRVLKANMILVKLFRSDQLYWWRYSEYLDITTDLLKVADNIDQNISWLYELHGGCLIRSRIYSPFATTWVQLRYFVWARLLIFYALLFSVVILFCLRSES